MEKKKILKLKIGEAYDKDSKKNLPVYKTYWQQDDGSYMASEKLFVSEVEVGKDKKEKQESIEA